MVQFTDCGKITIKYPLCLRQWGASSRWLTVDPFLTMGFAD